MGTIRCHTRFASRSCWSASGPGPSITFFDLALVSTIVACFLTPRRRHIPTPTLFLVVSPVSGGLVLAIRCDARFTSPSRPIPAVCYVLPSSCRHRIYADWRLQSDAVPDSRLQARALGRRTGRHGAGTGHTVRRRVGDHVVGQLINSIPDLSIYLPVS